MLKLYGAHIHAVPNAKVLQNLQYTKELRSFFSKVSNKSMKNYSIKGEVG